MIVVTFDSFVEFLYKIAVIEIPDAKNPEHAIAHYIEERILRKGLTLPSGVGNLLGLKYDEWFEEVDSFDFKELLDTKKVLLNTIYKKYQLNVPSIGSVIPLKSFLKFCHDVKIIPGLLSNSECNRVNVE